MRLPSNEKLITDSELKAFFGLLILFGVTKKNHIDLKEICGMVSVHHSDYATSCMPRDRFKLILSKITFDIYLN